MIIKIGLYAGLFAVSACLMALSPVFFLGVGAYWIFNDV